MEVEIRYYVIYAMDTFLKVSRAKPSYIKGKHWKMTESGKNDDWDVKEKKPNHRKYCGILTADQLKEMLEEEGYWSTCETMGALTLEFGLLPAISFDFEDENSFKNAYVSPILWNEDGIYKALDKLPKKQREKTLDMEIHPKMDGLLNFLKDLDSNAVELNIPSSLDLKVEQMIIPFPIK